MIHTFIRYCTVSICIWLVSTSVLFAESEPNNTPATATPLALGGSSSGTLASATDPTDWWVVTTTVDGKLFIQTYSDATVDVDLHIYDDPAGTHMIANFDIDTGRTETTHHNALQPGTYYIKAYYGGGTGGGSYTIQCTFTPTSLTNDSEPNDSSAVAVPLTLNSSSTGHLGHYKPGDSLTDEVDWWKVTTTFDGSLVAKTVSDSTLEIDLYLYDQDGKTQIAGYDVSYGTHDSSHFYCLTPGTYYIKALRYGSGYGSYSISNIFTPTALANDSEVNDSAQVATTLALNDSSTGHLGYMNRGVFDVYDWWKISLPADGNLTVRTYSDPTLDVDLYLYDIDGKTQIAGYDTSSGRNEATHYYGLKTGTYYVKAYRWGSDGSKYGSYRISSQYTAARLANDTEPNDSLQVARSIALNTTYTGHLGYFSGGVRDEYDFFNFTLPSAWDSLFIRTDSDSTIDVDLTLYDQSGNQIISASATGRMEMLKYTSAAAGRYSVRLKEYSGYGSYSVIVSNVRPTGSVVGVEQAQVASTLPTVFALNQNYPNPFNPKTMIGFQLPVMSEVSLKVYDILGREVATLMNEVKSPGTYTVKWDASQLSSGIYLYRLQAGKFVSVKRMILMK
jgi:hypothetical protein